MTTWGVITYDISDHFPIFGIIEISPKRHSENQVILSRDYSKINPEILSRKYLNFKNSNFSTEMFLKS